MVPLVSLKHLVTDSIPVQTQPTFGMLCLAGRPVTLDLNSR